MTFFLALEHMRAGERVKRSVWENIIFIDMASLESGACELNGVDILADDWEVLE